MTQEEVYKYMKKNRRWMTTQEIAKNFKATKGNICQNLNRLHKYGDVERRPIRINNYLTYEWRIL